MRYFLKGYMAKDAWEGDTLDKLHELKRESDRGNYVRKHKLFRELYKNNPESFEINSSEAGILGITHNPTGYRFHIPADKAPGNLTGYYRRNRSRIPGDSGLNSKSKGE